MDYASYDGLGLAELVKTGETTATELTAFALNQIEELNPRLNAVVHTAADDAQREAAKAPSGPFAGVPFLVKDLFLRVNGMPRSDGTRFRPDEARDTEDDLLTTRYRNAGLVILGKTNTPEYGITGTTEGQRLGPARSPWNTDHIAGGSSGGAASAVAAGLVPVAHSSDGLGSIRIPAACCGLVGLKPSRGRIPLGANHDAEMAVGYSVHNVVSRTVRDTAAMLDATAIPDPTCPLQEPQHAKAGAFLQATQRPPGSLRIAFSGQTPTGIPIDEEVQTCLDTTAKTLEGLGHKVEERHLTLDFPDLYRASTAILGANFCAAMAERVELMGREPEEHELEALTWRNWKGAQLFSGRDVGMGRRALARASRYFFEFFKDIDVFVCPVLAVEPPRIGHIDPVNLDPSEVDKRQAATFPFTPPFNMTGQPGISLPLFSSRNQLPIGMMFHSKYGDEATLLSLAAQLEDAMPWRDRRPQVWAGAA